MSKRLFDYYFWFAQPPTILEQADKYLGYIFAGLLVLAITFILLKKLSNNSINRGLFQKFWYLTLSTAIMGIVWLGIRYENTQIFGRRYWAGITLLIGIVWLLFIVKYLIFDYRRLKNEYEKEQVKNKYLPKAR
ncbi:MAG TPA: hypothetical protein VF974_01155 [Patescibacteria group bacterium]